MRAVAGDRAARRDRTRGGGAAAAALWLAAVLGAASLVGAAPAAAGTDTWVLYLPPPPAEAGAPWPRPAPRVPAAGPALLMRPAPGAPPDAPVVVLVGDAAGFDERVARYAPALLAGGIAVLALDPDGARGSDADGPPADAAPALAVEALHDARGALLTLRGAAPPPDGAPPLRPRRVGLLGLGTGGEAAALASFARAAPEGAAGFDAVAAVAPTCGPDLAAAIQGGEAPGPAPVLLVQPWADEANPERGACAALSGAAAGADAALRERVSVLSYAWARYGFDLAPLGPRAVVPHPAGEGLIEAVPEPGAAALALRAVAAFFVAALQP